MYLEMIKRMPEGNSRETPILFVHGAWHGAWCWDEFFLPYFAEHGYASYALSCQGHGSSDKSKRLQALRISDYVTDIAQVVADLPSPPILVGHSMGGLIVQKYLEKYPVPSAVLLAPLPMRGLYKSMIRMARRHPLLFLKANLTINMHPFISSTELVREAFYSEDIDSKLLDKYFSQLQDESYFAFIDMLLLSLPHPQKINTPLLVLGASNDRMFTPKEIELTARAYNTQSKIMGNMAHNMMLEKDWIKVADFILKWLEDKNL